MWVVLLVVQSQSPSSERARLQSPPWHGNALRESEQRNEAWQEGAGLATTEHGI